MTDQKGCVGTAGKDRVARIFNRCFEPNTQPSTLNGLGILAEAYYSPTKKYAHRQRQRRQKASLFFEHSFLLINRIRLGISLLSFQAQNT